MHFENEFGDHVLRKNLTINGPNGGATYEIWVLPVCGLQLPPFLKVVFLGSRRLGFETTRFRHFRV